MSKLGDRIIFFARTKLKTKVDRGECWDLAKKALQYAHAKNPPDDFGGELYAWGNVTTLGDAQPGDILQFENVALQCAIGDGQTYSGTVSHHTAIVESVDGIFITVLHQNFNGIKKVTRERLPIGGDCLSSGSIVVYRPVAKA